MQRSTSSWATALAAAALITLPAAAMAQSTASPQPPASQTATAPSGNTSASDTPADHVRAAKQALDSIPKTSIPAADRVKFAQLRTHLNSLERDVMNGGAAREAASGNWGTEAAAIDRIITQLTGPGTSEAAASSSAPAPTGTSGRSARGSRSAALDEQARNGLLEVRRHITELASSMSTTSAGAANSRQEQAAGSNPDTMGTAGSPAASQAGAQPPSSPSPSSPSSSTTARGTSQVDAAAAKQHLGEARDSLSQLTSMPEAARLQGDARTQVSQLISNFNELITTQSNWRAAYDKVDANLNALLGPDSGQPSAAASGTTGAAPSANAAGAQIDPAIRAKLVEFRTHMQAFEQAAGGGGSASSASSSMNPSVSTGSTSNPASPATSASSNPAATPATTSGAPSPAGTTGSTTSGTAGATGTTGSSTPSTAGTTGTYTPAPSTMEQTPSSTGKSSPSQSSANESKGRAEAQRHIDAIGNILNSARDGKLDKAQVDEIKMHLEQLRQALNESSKEPK